MKPLFRALLALQISAAALQAADPFAENVRTTDPLSPEEQLKAFKVPPGFEMQLIAAEPDMQKPMNMAFDSKGRLWVSMSREYPFPAPLDKPSRDTIRIYENFDTNGRAQKITVFAEGLNIPIGIYPYKNGVIAWSIPNIWYFEDMDGDGKSDRKSILYGPFGWERDTHGNQASFRRGFDGWLYATHGYNNISKVKARDGSQVEMQSGNTYRFGLDGGHIEQFTHGQVNPFGLCFDPAGNLYSADCHSAPIYELLRGGYYPSFGKPHDGLGFAPTLMEHSHGSTAIAGIVYYADNLWPEEYQKNIFIGNVMTSRLNRDRLVSHGSSKTATELPDFLTTTDPWFRPVDIQLGPDGNLYIADFYNRIIGHYEVPLQHPGRDRERARLWRLVYKDKPSHGLPDFSQSSAEELIAEFKSPNLPRRMLAMNELVDRFGKNAISPLRALLENNNATPPELTHAAWALHRVGGVDPQQLAKLFGNSDPAVRAHTMRLISELGDAPDQNEKELLLRGLKDSDPLVRRASADAMGRFPDEPVFASALLEALKEVPGEDNHLRHTIRMALRNQLTGSAPGLLSRSNLNENETRELAGICQGLPTAASANFLVQHLSALKESKPVLAGYVQHAVRYIDERGLSDLAKYIRANYKSDPDQQLAFFKALQEGTAQRGLQLNAEARSWGAELAEQLLSSVSNGNQSWSFIEISGKKPGNPWFLQERVSADGSKAEFLCSLPPGGEQLMGKLRSRSFEVPERLTFWVAGHDGYPANPAGGNNYIRLVSADGPTVFAKAAPPRNDTAQKVEWDLSAHKGKQAVLEIVDGDSGDAYAWLAVGRFKPGVVPLPSTSPNALPQRIIAAADMVRTLGLSPLKSNVGDLLVRGGIEASAQSALAQALVALSPSDAANALAAVAGDPSLGPELRTRVAQSLAGTESADSKQVLGETIRFVPARLQTRIAQSLAASASGAEMLLTMVEKSEAPARILQDKTVVDKFNAVATSSAKARFAKLTKDLEPANESAQKLIDERRGHYNAAKSQPLEGLKVFTQNCAVCHQIDGAGAVVGPQLDGIGSRGLERIVEDILDPNRNVDVNFRTQVLALKDGDVLSGLLRREEGELLVIADATGKEIKIPKNEIETRRESDTSLMPANFGDVIPEADFDNLLAFLLSKGVPTHK